jgi:hypothetical protein
MRPDEKEFLAAVRNVYEGLNPRYCAARVRRLAYELGKPGTAQKHSSLPTGL